MKKLSKFLIFTIFLTSFLGAGALAEKDDLPDYMARVSSFEGKNRVETSIEVSKMAYFYEDNLDTLLLAGYDGAADALSASFMAGEMKVPLLIANKNKISKNLMDEIKRLDPKEIILIGGENSLSKNIQEELEGEKFKTRRIKGGSRIETALEIARDYYGDKELKEVFLVEYNSLVDALAIGPVSARDGIPVLIANKDSIPKQVEDFLKEKAVEKVTVVGGETAISQKAVKDLESYVGNVERVYGKDRIETALSIADRYFKNPKVAFLANGWNNTDALIGGYYAAMENAPMLLTRQNMLFDNVADYIAAKPSKVYFLGGRSVLNVNVYRLTDWAVRGKKDPRPNPIPKPHSNFNVLPKHLPKGAVLTKKDLKEKRHEYKYNKKDSGGVSIQEVIMAHPDTRKDKSASYMLGEDKYGNLLIVYFNKDSSVSHASFFGPSPNLSSKEFYFFESEMGKFFEAYGYGFEGLGI